MLCGNTIKFSHMPFGLIPKVLNPIDVILFVSKQFWVIDPVVLKLRHIQHVIRTVVIGVHNAVWFNLFLYYTYQCFRFCICNDLSVSLAAPFDDTEHRNLARHISSAFAFPVSTKIAFINFDLTLKKLTDVSKLLILIPSILNQRSLTTNPLMIF